MHWLTGKGEASLESILQTRALLQELAEARPEVARYCGRLTICHINIGEPDENIGRPDKALLACREFLTIQRKLADDHPAVTEYWNQWGLCFNGIASVESQIGFLADALDSYHKALAIQRKLVDDHLAVAEFLNCLEDTHRSIDKLMLATGSPTQALAEFNESREMFQELTEDNPTFWPDPINLAGGHTSAVDALRALGQLDDVRRGHLQAVETHEGLMSANSSITNNRTGLAASVKRLGL